MWCRTLLAIGLLAVFLIACGEAGASVPSGSAAQSNDLTLASSPPVTGVCRAFLLGGPIDLGRQVLLLEASGEDPHELTDQMVQAFNDVTSDLSGTGADVEAFRALAETVTAGEPFEGAMEAFFDTFAEACGVNLVRH